MRRAAAALVALAGAVVGQELPHCTYAPTAMCFADLPVRPVSYLADAADASMTLESCAQLCAASGFPIMAATANSQNAFCYCGLSINPNAKAAPVANCSLPCPGNPAEPCGGDGFSAVRQLTCDGPLPPAPVGPPLAPGRACSQPESATWPFCNVSLPLESRVADLVSRVSLAEMGAQLTSRESPAIPRLGIPAFYWGTNAIHGITGSNCLQDAGVCPTSWPNGVAMAASWNATAWHLMGTVTGRELRALDNVQWSQMTQPNGGLTAWGPTINLLRDPRWGRTQESASECPLVAGMYGAAVSAGLQVGDGADPRFLLAVATLKHMVAYSLEDYGPNNDHQWMRQTFNAIVSDFDLADSYLPIFQRAVQVGGAAGIMYAANELNGVPCAGSTLLDGALHSWGFDGYRCTDGGQIINMVTGHHFVPTLDQAIGYAVRAESDIADGPEYQQDLLNAVVNGNTTLTGARQLLTNTLRIRFRLGLFDPPAGQVYLTYGTKDINDARAQAGAALASREALVLLKNQNGVLPLQAAATQRSAPQHGGRPAGRVALIGPNCNSTLVLQGNYGGAFCLDGPHGPETDCLPSILMAIQAAYAPDAQWVQGSGVNTVTPGGLEQAAQLAASADTIIMCLGLDQTQEAEQHDRYNLTLPAPQLALFNTVAAAAAPSSTPLIVVLIHGGAIALPEVAAGASAILDGFYPGVTAGSAIADAIFGAYNPGGKLPYTVYPPEYQFAYNFTHMDIANSSVSGGASGGRTYRYYTGEPLWPFGFGLSYSNWTIAWSGTPPPATVSLSVSSPSSAVMLNLSLTNVGPLDGDEVVQAYYAPVRGSFGLAEPPFLPIQQVFAFQRLHVRTGQTATLAIPLAATDLQVTDNTNTKRPLPGQYLVTLSRGPFTPALRVNVVLNQ